MTEQPTNSSAEPPKRRSVTDHLRPWEVQRLIRLLASGEYTKAECGRKVGITPPAVTYFCKVHAERIAEVRAHLDDEFAGMWIARKAERLAAYESEYQDLLDNPKAGHHEWSKARQSILRNVAEELGQLPNRSQVAVSGGVTIRMLGVDLDEVFPEPGTLGTAALSAAGSEPDGNANGKSSEAPHTPETGSEHGDPPADPRELV